MNREKALITIAIISVCLYTVSLHLKTVNDAYETGYLMGKAGDAWIYSSWTMDDLELLQANDLDSLSKGLEIQLDLQLGDIFLAQYLDTKSTPSSDIEKQIEILSERNRPVLVRAAIYRSKREGIFIWQGSDRYKELMSYLPKDTIRGK